MAAAEKPESTATQYDRIQYAAMARRCSQRPAGRSD